MWGLFKGIQSSIATGYCDSDLFKTQINFLTNHVTEDGLDFRHVGMTLLPLKDCLIFLQYFCPTCSQIGFPRGLCYHCDNLSQLRANSGENALKSSGGGAGNGSASKIPTNALKKARKAFTVRVPLSAAATAAERTKHEEDFKTSPEFLGAQDKARTQASSGSNESGGGNKARSSDGKGLMGEGEYWTALHKDQSIIPPSMMSVSRSVF
jgi:hypothetical protein